MNRHQPTWRRSGTVVLVAMLLAAASPASARIGSPLKKIKDKIGKAAEPKSGSDASADKPVAFDDVTVELTDQRIEAILATFDKAREASAGRAPLVQKLNAKKDERGKIWDKNGEAIQDLQRKRSDAEICYHDGYRAAQDRRTEEYKARALGDPALRDKFMRAAQEYNAAAAKGDSTAIAKLQKILEGEVLATSEDSAKVRQSCGPLPPPSGAELKLQALDKDIATLEEEIRQIDEKVAAAQSDEGGLNRQQWGMALDRIQAYLSQVKSQKSDSKAAPRGFSEEELKALEKHIEKLRAALG
jgi:hypothetical protein